MAGVIPSIPGILVGIPMDITIGIIPAGTIPGIVGVISLPIGTGDGTIVPGIIAPGTIHHGTILVGAGDGIVPGITTGLTGQFLAVETAAVVMALTIPQVSEWVVHVPDWQPTATDAVVSQQPLLAVMASHLVTPAATAQQVSATAADTHHRATAAAATWVRVAAVV